MESPRTVSSPPTHGSVSRAPPPAATRLPVPGCGLPPTQLMVGPRDAASLPTCESVTGALPPAAPRLHVPGGGLPPTQLMVGPRDTASLPTRESVSGALPPAAPRLHVRGGGLPPPLLMVDPCDASSPPIDEAPIAIEAPPPAASPPLGDFLSFFPQFASLYPHSPRSPLDHPPDTGQEGWSQLPAFLTPCPPDGTPNMDLLVTIESFPQDLPALKRVIMDAMPVSQYVLGKSPIDTYTLYSTESCTVTTVEGRMLLASGVIRMITAYREGETWCAQFELKHLFVKSSRDGIELHISITPILGGDFRTFLLDLLKVLTLLLPLYGQGDDQAKYVQHLYDFVTNINPTAPLDRQESYITFIRNHPFLRSPTARVQLFMSLGWAHNFMGKSEKLRFVKVADGVKFGPANLDIDWRDSAKAEPLFRKIFMHNETKTQARAVRTQANAQVPKKPKWLSSYYKKKSSSLSKYLRQVSVHLPDHTKRGDDQMLGDTNEVDYLMANKYDKFVADLLYELIHQLHMEAALKFVWCSFTGFDIEGGLKMVTSTVPAASINCAENFCTTSATVLTKAIFIEICKSIEAPVNPIDLRRGISMAVDAVVTELNGMSRMIKTSEEIAQVGTMSCYGQREIGELIAKAMEKVGKDGVITTSDYIGVNINSLLEIKKGVKLDRGYSCPNLINNHKNKTCELDAPLILIYEKRTSGAHALNEVLKFAQKKQRSLLIIAEDVEREAFDTFIIAAFCSGIKCCVVNVPGFGENRKGSLDDLAIFVGGEVITEKSGMSLEGFGTCKKVTVSVDCTIILNGAGDKAAIEGRAEQLRSAIEQSTSDHDKEKLQERLAKLSGRVAVLKVDRFPEIDEVSRVNNALQATKAALEEGIVPGGGFALLYASRNLHNLQTMNTDQTIGVQIIQNALQAVMRRIFSSAGADGALVVDTLLSQNHTDIGFDVAKDEYVDTVEEGIIDPLKVIRMSLLDAASKSYRISTKDSIIVEIPRDEEPHAIGVGEHRSCCS